MHWIDWSIIAAYILLVTGIGFLFIKKASGSVAEYFVAGRNLPWWLAGTSLVATSFAADTPLWVTGVIATKGIAGNWIWWNQAIVWVLAVIFFARMWRRSQVVTDAEFIELRYSGKPAAFLRGFRAVFVSCILSTTALAWVMLAMQKIVGQIVVQPGWVTELHGWMNNSIGLAPASPDHLWKLIVLIGLFAVATFYTVLSGFWGIVVTDLIQFVIAMFASVMFAVIAVDHVGGITELKLKLVETFGSERAGEMTSFLPGSDSQWMPVWALAVYLSIVWLGDCNGFAAQRMFSTRTEKDSVLSAVWYSIAHFVLRPWPWVVVALVALVTYPELVHNGDAAAAESGYPRLMMQILPAGLKGLMIASLLAAFMSTVDTHLNWNASYFVTDVYKRFISPGASERMCVMMSRLAVLGFAALAITISYFLDSINSAVEIMITLGSSIGLALVARWFWWRVNAWTEISAMIASLVFAMLSRVPGWIVGMADADPNHQFMIQSPELYSTLNTMSQWHSAAWMLTNMLACSVVWITVTFLTTPVHADQLDTFYRRVKPLSLFWKPVASRCPEVNSSFNLGLIFARWFVGVGWIYSLMVCVGKLTLGEPRTAAVAAGIFAVLSAAGYFAFRGGGLLSDSE